MEDVKTSVLELLADVVYDLFVAETVNDNIAQKAFADWSWDSEDLDDPDRLQEAIKWFKKYGKWYSIRFKPL